MNTQGWIEPGSEADMALHGFKTACAQVLDPKYLEAFITEARLSNLITEVHDMALQVMSHLTHIENEAEARTNMDEFERTIDRIGGFA